MSNFQNANLLTRGTKIYQSPMIQINLVEIEHSIATGSATVNPVNSNNQVREEWETSPDVVGEMEW